MIMSQLKTIRKLLTVFSLILLMFIVVIGFFQAFTNLISYGWSYEVTTVISNVKTSQTMYVLFEFMICFFLLYLCYVLVQYYYTLSPKKKEGVFA